MSCFNEQSGKVAHAFATAQSICPVGYSGFRGREREILTLPVRDRDVESARHRTRFAHIDVSVDARGV